MAAVNVHLMMKRGNKILGRSIANLVSHHQQHTTHTSFALPLRRDTTSSPAATAPTPTPLFSHGSAISNSMRRLAYFPCLGAVADQPHHVHVTPWRPAVALQSLDYSPSPACLSTQELPELAPAAGTQQTPAGRSPFSVSISDYSSEEELVEHGVLHELEVDHDAEEFIRRFYEQLRKQNQIASLHSHEMLARGM